MNDLDFTQLGVSGVIVVLLIIAVTKLWTKCERLEKQAREDQERVLPALTQASVAMTAANAAMTEFVRTTAVLRDRG